MNRDIIAIGGSAGAVDVLLNLVGELPVDLPAAIFVVLHTPPDRVSVLPELLSRRGPLPARHPHHGERFERGKIYVAPPDTQLMLRDRTMEVVRGPRENGHRPAVDALFRSAAQAHGPRVVGVVLSGHQDCGTAGMMSIKARGGLGVVQSPDSAAAREMPNSVIGKVPIDHVVHPLELPGLLARLAHSEAPAVGPDPPRDVRQMEGGAPGAPVDLVCPLCQGVLTEAQAGAVEQFRCHVGHTFSLESLVREQGEEMERALWAAVRALEEGATLSGRLASGEKNAAMQRRFREKQETQAQQAHVIREILLRGMRLGRNDANRLSEEGAGGPGPRE